MHRTPFLLLALALPCTLPAQSADKAPTSTQSSTPDWEVAIRLHHQQLIDHNGPGTDTVLRDQLIKMRDIDQEARGLFLKSSATPEEKQQMKQNLPVTDAQLTQQLKQIVDQKGWPTIALVGIDASNAATLIMIHSSDHAWQRQLLPQLEQLADTGKIDGSSLALLIDKELISEGKLQRYGTQFSYVNGGMAMYAVEDPADLDKRRESALLPPISVYKDQLEKMYHLKASSTIISPPAPAKEPAPAK